MRVTKKMLKQIYIQNLLDTIFLWDTQFLFQSWKTLSKIKNSILHQIYAGYKKNFRKRNCVFQIDLQNWFLTIFS